MADKGITAPHPTPLNPDKQSVHKQYRGAVITSQCHDSKISGSQQTTVLQMWQKKIDMYDFVHDCTQEQHFSSIVQQCKCRLCQERSLRSRGELFKAGLR